jgi:hypothetical protein
MANATGVASDARVRGVTKLQLHMGVAVDLVPVHQNFAVNRSRDDANVSGLVTRRSDRVQIACAQFIYAPNRENGPPIGLVHAVVDGGL